METTTCTIYLKFPDPLMNAQQDIAQKNFKYSHPNQTRSLNQTKSDPLANAPKDTAQKHVEYSQQNKPDPLANAQKDTEQKHF